MENILSSLSLETGTVNDILIINSTWLKPLLLGAVKIFRHVTRYETPARERAFFAYTSLPAPFNGIRNCSYMEKIILSANSFSFHKLFYIECFFCLKFFPSDRMSGVFFVWSDNLWFWSDIVRCPTVILRSAVLLSIELQE